MFTRDHQFFFSQTSLGFYKSDDVGVNFLDSPPFPDALQATEVLFESKTRG